MLYDNYISEKSQYLWFMGMEVTKHMDPFANLWVALQENIKAVEAGAL